MINLLGRNFCDICILQNMNACSEEKRRFCLNMFNEKLTDVLYQNLTSKMIDIKIDISLIIMIDYLKLNL